MTIFSTDDVLRLVAKADSEPSFGRCGCGCGESLRTQGTRFVAYHHEVIKPWRRLAEVIADSERCWTWPGALSRGYGSVTVQTTQHRAHRWVWTVLRGPIPNGLVIDHLCRNRACVNPDHLEPVTFAENVRRGEKPSRTHCLNGHRYDEVNTHVRRRDGSRMCRTCHREAERARRAKAEIEAGKFGIETRVARVPDSARPIELEESA